jgi:FdhE protein
MSGAPSRRAELGRGRPECEPWLALLELARQETRDPSWRRGADATRLTHEPDAPVLASATLVVEAPALTRYVGRLLATAAGRAFTIDADDAVACLAAAVEDDRDACDALGARIGPPGDMLRAVLPLIAMPLLRACHTRWSSLVSPAWMRPLCPVCGAWPALAEVRGLERTRRFRCLRCAADWAAAWLACPYCGNGDHTQLGALVPEKTAETRKAETCKRCLGYLKSIAVLQATAADDLALLDVETLELDVAAVESGYARPAGLGCRLGVRIERARRSPGRLRGWLR